MAVVRSVGDQCLDALRGRLADIRSAIQAGAESVASSLTDIPSLDQWQLSEVSASFGVTPALHVGPGQGPGTGGNRRGNTRRRPPRAVCAVMECFDFPESGHLRAGVLAQVASRWQKVTPEIRRTAVERWLSQGSWMSRSDLAADVIGLAPLLNSAPHLTTTLWKPYAVRLPWPLCAGSCHKGEPGAGREQTWPTAPGPGSWAGLATCL
jgi:hypothetical protein